MLHESIDRIRKGSNLSFEESAALAGAIFESEGDDALVASLLVALADKGETGAEIAGFARALLDRSLDIEVPAGTVDLCGTGGSGLSRFNVSTSAAFVVAACGIPVAKHGNRGSRLPNGSFDLLDALGLRIDLSPIDSSRALEATGLAFLYARQYHPIMKKVGAARKLADRRTIFNLAGPLSNPADVGVQLIGTADASQIPALAEAVRILGKSRVLIVTGEPGIDELSISGDSTLCEVTQDGKRTYTLTPSQVGVTPVEYTKIPSGLAETNVDVFHDFLDNRADATIPDVVALNAGALIYATGSADSIPQGFSMARAAIEDGRTKRKFEQYSSFLENVG